MLALVTRCVLAAVAALLVGAAPSGAQPSHSGDKVDPQILDGTEQRRLDDARARWDRASLRNYRFRVALQCFCLPDVRRPRVIVVRRGHPQRPPSHLRWVATVPRMFLTVQEAIDERVSGLDVRYGRRGVPRRISVDPRSGIADDEHAYEVDRFRRG
jgi:hypothetical protein